MSYHFEVPRLVLRIDGHTVLDLDPVTLCLIESMGLTGRCRSVPLPGRHAVLEVHHKTEVWAFPFTVPEPPPDD